MKLYLERDKLSPRELETLRFLALGMPIQSIANNMGIAKRTVNTHIQSIYTKWGVHSRSDALRYAIIHGVVHISDLGNF